MPPRHQPTHQCPFEECEKITFTSKGSAEKHLLNIHVTERQLQCTGCEETFSTVPKVKKHCRKCNKCNSDEMAFKESKTSLTFYASEHLRTCYPTPHKLIKDLLPFCNIGQGSLPQASYDWKILTLLEHPVFHTLVGEVSVELLHHPNRWRELTWNVQRAKDWSKKLERAFSADAHHVNVNDIPLPTSREFLRELIVDGMEHSGITRELVPQPHEAFASSDTRAEAFGSDRPQRHGAASPQGMEFPHDGTATTHRDHVPCNGLYLSTRDADRAQVSRTGNTSRGLDPSDQHIAFWNVPPGAVVFEQQVAFLHPPQALPDQYYYRVQSSQDPVSSCSPYKRS